MVINTSKSHYLLCNASENTRFSISIDGTVLERRSKSRLLGYTICDTLSWNDHVSDLCDGIRSNVALLQPCRFCISRRAAIILYHHFLSFHFIHGVHIYYICSKKGQLSYCTIILCPFTLYMVFTSIISAPKKKHPK